MGRLGGIAPIRALRHKAKRTPLHKIHLLVSALERTCSMEKGHLQHRFAKPLNRKSGFNSIDEAKEQLFHKFCPCKQEAKERHAGVAFCKKACPELLRNALSVLSPDKKLFRKTFFMYFNKKRNANRAFVLESSKIV